MTSSSEQPQKERILSISSCYDCPNRMEMVCLYKPLGMIPMPSGKEAFDYRNRYVCTEKDDQEITDDLPYWCPLPSPHPAPGGLVCDICHKQMETEAARQAREEAYGQLHGQIDHIIDQVLEITDNSHLFASSREVHDKINSLRTTTPHTEQEQPR